MKGHNKRRTCTPRFGVCFFCFLYVLSIVDQVPLLSHKSYFYSISTSCCFSSSLIFFLFDCISYHNCNVTSNLSTKVIVSSYNEWKESISYYRWSPLSQPHVATLLLVHVSKLNITVGFRIHSTRQCFFSKGVVFWSDFSSFMAKTAKAPR